MDLPGSPCYDRTMRAFLGHADQHGLRGFVAEDTIPASLVGPLVRGWAARPAAVFRAVVDEDAAEAIRRELANARPADACGLLLNRAVELVPLGAAGRPGPD
jgi:hypothetical protein